MHWLASLSLLLVTVCGLMGLGLPVAFAFLVTDLIGVYLFMGGTRGFTQLIGNALSSVTIFTLVPVPLFLLMGELFFHTGIAVRVFDALDKCLGRLPGRLSFLTVGGGTLFAALSGSSIANTAMMGSMMVPEMNKRGYKPIMSIGAIMGTGGLAILIPPSALAVLLGSIARVDIGALLIAGVMPGLLLAVLYVALILGITRIDPQAAPAYEIARPTPWEVVQALVVDVLPMGVIVFLVVGLILLGWATPSESAAFGVGGVVLLAAAFRKLTWSAVVKSLDGTLRVTVMSFLIILASSTFSQILAFSGASGGLISWATSVEMPAWVALLVMFGIVVALGCFMDQLSIMLLTVPIFFPLATVYGMDPIWLAIIIMMGLEIGLTTPPFGLLLFIMQGVAPKGTTFAQICWAAAPFIACALLVSVLIMIFPPIALWLPGLISAP
jgi:tripartite ATP-independent transporter DctM subunit